MSGLLHAGLSNALVAVVLALVAVVVGRTFRRPALTHGLWLLVLLKLVTPPLVGVSIPWPSSPPGPTVLASERTQQTPPANQEVRLGNLSAPKAQDPVPEEPHQAVRPVEPEPATVPPPQNAEATVPVSFPGGWQGALAALWLAGTVAWLGLALARARRFRRLLSFARPVADDLRDEVEVLAARMGLRHAPRAWLVPGRLPPMLWALGGAPRLLLPAELLGSLTREQRAALLVHELAHLCRRDHWTRLLELLATALFWWHPVVWWARRELREAEEQCCDAWVVWVLPCAGRAYATALIECLDFLSVARTALPVGASGLGHTDNLKRRLTMIMRGKTPRRLTLGSGLALGGLALLLPLVPTFAQDREGPDKPREPRVERREERREERGDQRREERPAANPDEVRRARENVEKLKRELEERMQQVRAAEERLRDAAAHLARLEGRPTDGRGIRIIIVGPEGKGTRIVGPEVRGRFTLPGLPGRAVPMTPTPPRPARPGQPETRSGPRPTVPGAPPGRAETRNPGAPDRLRELERRLDEMMRQLEEMRRRMPGPRGGQERGPGNERGPRNERGPGTERGPRNTPPERGRRDQPEKPR
jgi:beta-lactamase regulating signal transducer with metallopeptidase domain